MTPTEPFPPELAFIMGTIFGIACMWWLARRDRKKGIGPEAGLAEQGRTVELLTLENEKLNGQVLRLEDRLSVLERIATDQPLRLAREIDSLRLGAD